MEGNGEEDLIRMLHVEGQAMHAQEGWVRPQVKMGEIINSGHSKVAPPHTHTHLGLLDVPGDCDLKDR